MSMSDPCTIGSELDNTAEAALQKLDLSGFTADPQGPGVQPIWARLRDLLEPLDHCNGTPYDKSTIDESAVPAAVYNRLALYLPPEKLALAFFKYIGLNPLSLLMALGAPAAMLFGVLAEAARNELSTSVLVNASPVIKFDDIVFLFTPKGWTVYLQDGVKINVAGFNWSTGRISSELQTYAICASKEKASETFSKLKSRPGALTFWQQRQIP